MHIVRGVGFKRKYLARYILFALGWNGDAGNLIPAVNHLGNRAVADGAT
jgi:hypothetical protein